MRKTIFKKLEAQGLIANYNRLRKNLPPKLPDRVFIWDETFREGIKAPTVYLTSGCPSCNRPYYNEKPSGPIYNYPLQPNKEEIEKIKKQLSY